MRIPEEVMCDARLSLRARCVYGILALNIYRGNVAKIGQREIATKLGEYQPKISPALKELAAAGHIEIQGKGQARRSYRLVSPLFVDETKVTRMPKRRKKLALLPTADEVFG